MARGFVEPFSGPVLRSLMWSDGRDRRVERGAAGRRRGPFGFGDARRWGRSRVDGGPARGGGGGLATRGQVQNAYAPGAMTTHLVPASAAGLLVSLVSGPALATALCATNPVPLCAMEGSVWPREGAIAPTNTLLWRRVPPTAIGSPTVTLQEGGFSGPERRLAFIGEVASPEGCVLHAWGPVDDQGDRVELEADTPWAVVWDGPEVGRAVWTFSSDVGPEPPPSGAPEIFGQDSSAPASSVCAANPAWLELEVAPDGPFLLALRGERTLSDTGPPWGTVDGIGDEGRLRFEVDPHPGQVEDLRLIAMDLAGQVSAESEPQSVRWAPEGCHCGWTGREPRLASPLALFLLALLGRRRGPSP